jgi:signal transduction histidine kinase
MIAAALEPLASSRAMLDAPTWRVALDSFAHVTGITATLYDGADARLVGPLCASPVARHLEACGLFAETGRATAIERALAARAIATRDIATDRVENAIVVSALPFFVDGDGIAALVFGWVFDGFSDPLECERVGRYFDISGAKLWAEVRQHRPTSAASFAKATALLRTLVDSSLTQLATVERLRALAQERERFLARVSHELRTPLQSILMRIEMMLHQPPADPGALNDALTALKASAQREARLVEDLIEVSRSTNGQLSMAHHPIDLSSVLEDAAQQLRPIANAASVAFVLEPSQRDATLVGDALRLGQVAQNLIGNAIRATPAGGRVTLALHVDAKEVGFDVIDTGVGIEPHALPHVFDAFTQFGEESQRTGGLGLGLTIARHIVEAHGGRIEALSDGRDCGACFSVRLPRAAG